MCALFLKTMYFVIGMHSPGEPIITSASPGDPYSMGKNIIQFSVYFLT